MASLFNTRISDTYVGLIKSLDNAAISTTLKQLSDGSGNSLGIYVNTSGDFKVNGILEWGSLKDTGENITITKFVDEADGISNNDNDTTIPTSAAVKDYVDTQITAEDLDFSGDSGSGSVDLDSQTFAIVGTTNEIETSATGQQLQIGLPSTISVNVTGNVTGNLTGDVTGNITATSVLADGVTGTTQSQGDNSTKIATTSYVDSAIGNNNELSEVLANGNTTGGTDISVSTGDNITFADSTKAIFGNDSDLQIYHDNVNSYIADAGAGSLRILVDDLRIRNAANNAAVITGIDGGSVFLYHNGNEKIKTISTGIDVTGSATISSDLILSDYGSGTHTGTATQRLGVDSSGNVIEIPIGAGAVDGSGTANTVTMWSDTDTITDAPITISGNDSTFAGTILSGSTDSIRKSVNDSLMTVSGGNATNAGANYQLFGSTHASLANIHRWRIGGSEAMRLDSLGNVGISTSAPVSLLDLSNGNTQGDGISFGSNATEIRRGNSGANLQMSHFGNISMIIDSDNNDSSRFFNVMHGNNDSSSATELFRVQEDGLVGIGTTSPSSYDSNADDLVIASTGNTGITIAGGTTGASSIYFADGTSGGAEYTGFIDYLHSSDALRFGTNGGSERARITSDGDFLLGKTGNNIATVGIELRENGLVSASRDAGTPLIANREGTVKGNMIDLRQDNSPILTIGTSGDNVFIAGTTNVSDLLLRSNGLNRIRIHDYGLTSFDTYGSINQTSTDRLHHFQIFTMDCVAGASGVAKDFVNIGSNTNITIHVYARQDSSNIGTRQCALATANGTGTVVDSIQNFVGNVTDIDVTRSGTKLRVAVTYTGTAPQVHIVIDGVCDVDMTKDSAC